jgi:hypothetical protein
MPTGYLPRRKPNRLEIRCNTQNYLQPEVNSCATSLKGRRLIALGDMGGVKCAFGFDAVGPVLLAGAFSGGHHEPTLS